MKPLLWLAWIKLRAWLPGRKIIFRVCVAVITLSCFHGGRGSLATSPGKYHGFVHWCSCALIKVMNNFYTFLRYELTCTLKNIVAHEFYISTALKMKRAKTLMGPFMYSYTVYRALFALPINKSIFTLLVRTVLSVWPSCVCFGFLFGTSWKI